MSSHTVLAVIGAVLAVAFIHLVIVVAAAVIAVTLAWLGLAIATAVYESGWRIHPCRRRFAW